MRYAIDETKRRRKIQIAYNQAHDIEPMSIVKEIRDITDEIASRAVAEKTAEYKAFAPGQMPKDELSRLIKGLEKQMKAAAEMLEFEKAAGLRDQIFELREILVDKQDLKPWQRARALSGEG
jgi:excinuclease ABC subunit B